MSEQPQAVGGLSRIARDECHFRLPKQILRTDGEPRRVGVELEFSGLSLDTIEDLLIQAGGIRFKRQSNYASIVSIDGLGEVKVELDARIFSELKLRKVFADLQIDEWKKDFGSELEHRLSEEARRFVPYELVFPPVPIDQLNRVDRIRAVLANAAEGTRASLFNAFGTHLNPELPQLDVATLLAYLRAYLVLEKRLETLHDVDPSRRLLPFIDHFPMRYVERVMNPDYRPDLTDFAADYLEFNPTRNRPLDFLPVLKLLCEQQVHEALPKVKISSRPTLHYRLPNCLIDDPEWSVAVEWNRWLEVERLASDADTLRRACAKLHWRLCHPWRARLQALIRPQRWFARRWRPVVAVTGPDHGGFPAWICSAFAIRWAGGIPLRITPAIIHSHPAGAQAIQFDALLLGGGADVDPKSYSDLLDVEEETSEPADDSVKRERGRWLSFVFAPLFFVVRRIGSLRASGIDLDRDQVETVLLKRALDEGKPVLGICRGMQLLNTVLGGSLFSDISGFYTEVGKVTSVLPRHSILLVEQTRLQELLRCDSTRVNSLHEQAINRLGRGLIVSARDKAGVIQAIETRGQRFRVGVQWHPEYLPTIHRQRRLFRGLINAAHRYHEESMVLH
jgi:gamma-glutamyl-gamma-aminobutyrate hydrolase PuuD